MRRRVCVAVFGAVFLVQSLWALSMQTPKVPRPLRTEKVKGDLYMIAGEGGNVALYATSEGVILVDDMFDRNHADILAQVKAITDRPLKYVINTHQHDDHAGGDFKMLPIAEVIAHKNVRANLTHIKQPYYEDTPGTPIGLPRITFTDELDVHLGGKDVQAYYFGRGHTSGDAVIYFPEQKTIHTGDLFLSTRAPARADNPPRPRGVPIYVDYAQGRQLLRLVEDARRRAAARLRYRHSGARSGGRKGRPPHLQGRSRSHARATGRSDCHGQQPGAAREDTRRRLRLALDGLSREPANAGLPAVSAG
jgi:glyoxylase-like metal-dependent hydrolase (beta-lactamase superfamily II)